VAKFDKAKLLVLRSNIDTYLKKLAEQEKDSYRKLASGYEQVERSLNRIIEILLNETKTDKTMAALKLLKKELGEAIQVAKPDMSEVVKAVDNLSKSLLTQDRKEGEVVKRLEAIEKVLTKNTPKKEVKAVDRTDEVIKAIKSIKLKVPEFEFPSEVNVNPGSHWPPQKVPNPVTHININSLKGNVHQTTTTVTTTLTPLPSYGVLDDRRAIIFYNNSSSITVYIGGSTVTASTGTPIEPKSFSPSFDSGPLQKWYGITSSGTADVRCLELPDEASGR